MARNKTKIVDLLIERRMTDSDFQFRNQPMKDRLDRIGALLNAFIAKWNQVNPNAQVIEKPYDPKVIDALGR